MYDSSDSFVQVPVISTPMRTPKDFWEQILVHEVMTVHQLSFGREPQSMEECQLDQLVITFCCCSEGDR
jgi:hypothetical protein